MNSLTFLGIILLAASSMSNPLSSDTKLSCILEGSSISELSSIKQSCTNITIQDLTVPAGQTLDLSGLKSGTTVTFDGVIDFGTDDWQYGLIILVGGNLITVNGAPGNRIDGGGSSYNGGNGEKTKPKLFNVENFNNSVIKNLNIYDFPVHAISIDRCHNLTVENVLMNNSKVDFDDGYNTSGFDVDESTQITLRRSVIYNQGDCVAINSGSNIRFENNYCAGGHGVSVGSLGGRSNNIISDVVVKNCEVANSDNGIRIQTEYGKTGSVSDITFEDITLTNIKNCGITIRDEYINNGTNGVATDGVPIKKLTVKNVHGTIKSGGIKVMILVRGASQWDWSDVILDGGQSASDCYGIPSGSGAMC
ncbi:polygalacturonase-like [Agrilus planipennis]|uniref:endo-polygalacturonase n=1 Tax=Agrilus planipennis TaxID=224129 RepID=A0A1W4WVH0_AGRPL|nr:polygalacturonase-like [Agrilus planipennis]